VGGDSDRLQIGFSKLPNPNVRSRDEGGGKIGCFGHAVAFSLADTPQMIGEIEW
jgi:hypothetical protein